MTKAMLTTATVAHQAGLTDVAMPAGTTVADLMAMLRIDTTNQDLAITLPDGTPAALGAVIGTEVPSGTVLTLASGEVTFRARQEQAESTDEAWLAIATATGATLAISLMLGIGLLLLPLFIPELHPGYLTRLLAGVVIIAALTTLTVRGYAKTVSIGPLMVPGLIGLAAMAPIDPSFPDATRIALAGGTTIAALASFISWQFGRRTASATAALWGLAAAIALGTAALGADAAQVGAILICAGLGAVLLAPSFATSVPDSQLLDQPLVSTSAAGLRIPAAPKPSRITARRVRATLASATSTTDTITMAGVSMAVIGSGALATGIELSTTAGQAALACLLMAVIALSLVPRGSRSGLTQTAPRIGAALMLTVAAVGGTGGAPDSAALVAAVIVGVGFAVVLGVATSSRKQHSALLGRLADIVQGLCLVLLLPAAFIASNAFGLIWQAAS